MANARRPDPLLLIVAVFSRHPAVFDWALPRLEQAYGPVALTSLRFPFVQTSYYEASMGPGLLKELWVFRDLLAGESLAAVKLRTNALEAELAESGQFPETRPLNLDPGMMSLGKFMLATTKDQAHRLYLRQGIYAEVTLRFQDGAFEPWPWTYADYRLEVVRSFLKEARNFYRQQLNQRMQDEG
jgi:hypothetical protein